MAKPIRATPTLKGIEAVNFIKEVIKEEKKTVQSEDKPDKGSGDN